MPAQEFHESKLIIDSSGDEVINLWPDITGNEEADVLILSDNNLEKELAE